MYIITLCKQKDCINRHIASAGITSCLREQNHVIEKFYGKPKVFGFKFRVGLRVKNRSSDSPLQKKDTNK